MTKQLMVCSIFGAFIFAGNVMAQCPSNLSVEQKYDCIVLEGAGSSDETSADVVIITKQETVNKAVKDNDKLAAVNP